MKMYSSGNRESDESRRQFGNATPDPSSPNMSTPAHTSTPKCSSPPSTHSPISFQTSPFPSSPFSASPPSGSYRNVPMIAEPVEQFAFLAALTAGIGPRAIVAILRTFCQAFAIYRSGLPDLTLWKTDGLGQRGELGQKGGQNIPQLKVKFVEVKSENDRLSEKQRSEWLINYHLQFSIINRMRNRDLL